MATFWISVAGCTGTVVAAWASLPHIWHSQTKRWYGRLTPRMFNMHLPEDTKKNIDSVLETLELPLEKEAQLSFFYCKGLECQSYGAISSRLGSLIGVPGSLTHRQSVLDTLANEKLLSKRVSDEAPSEPEPNLTLDPKSDLISDPMSPPVTGELERQLTDSMLLSEKAERFLIAREIMYTDTAHVYVAMAIAPIVTTMTVVLSDFVYTRQQRLKRTTPLVGVGCLAAYLLSLPCMRLLFQLNEHAANETADRKACLISREYAEGAAEYYQKAAQRNAALRSLGRARDVAAYTEDGGHTGRTWYVQSVSPALRLRTARTALAEYDRQDRTEGCDTV